MNEHEGQAPEAPSPQDALPGVEPETPEGHFRFPRTMVRGKLAGQRFETQREYSDALAAASGKRKTPVVKGGAERFELRVVSGSVDARVTGDPRSAEDVAIAVAVLRGER